jgi:hypothetical protein
MKQAADLLAKMAHQRIYRQAGRAKAQVHLHHEGLQLSPEPHLRHLMRVGELKAPKQKVCHPDMCIYILRFPALDYSIVIAMPRIACAKMIILQIC